jgi:mono/diheme cytochrome c family protein
MKAFVLGIVVTLVVIGAGVWCVSRFGLYPIGADNPPSSLELTLAGRAMDVYAENHMPQGPNPVEITPAALIEGATAYEQRCALCHGGAKAHISPLRDRFNPPAPQLINKIPHDPEPWLFWVTKHGVRMTGMPTWSGVLNDDQIWKVVAFIKRSGALPANVNAAWQQAAADMARPGVQ